MGSYTKLTNELRLCLDDNIATSEDGIRPNLSIIVLTRNNVKTIVNCLSSVLIQTYKNFELTILDNNSSDGTEELIKILTCDCRIKLLNCQKDGLKFNVTKALKYITTNKVLVIKPTDIMGEEDIEILMQTNDVKDFPHINYYPKWKLKLIKIKRFFEDVKELFYEED